MELRHHAGKRPPGESEPAPLDLEAEQPLCTHDPGGSDADRRGANACDQLDALDRAHQEQPHGEEADVPTAPDRNASHEGGLPGSV